VSIKLYIYVFTEYVFFHFRFARICSRRLKAISLL